MRARDVIDEYENQPPKHQKHRPGGRKRWGIESWSHWFQKWVYRDWYTSEKARDQALTDLIRKTKCLNNISCRKPRYRKVDR